MGLPYNRIGYAFASKEDQERLKEQFRQDDMAEKEAKDRNVRYKRWRQDCRKRMEAVDEVRKEQDAYAKDLAANAPSLQRNSAPGGVGLGVNMNKSRIQPVPQTPNLGIPGSRAPSVAGSALYDLREPQGSSLTDNILKKR